ncbi:hypothetical protein HYX00_05545 [Candidatus Woesearchaeota archaeon]|nr:hypothetical protein [Candidatus Woesearchaeota archaeon]
MPKSLFFHNKKSDVDISLVHLLEVFLAIGIVLVLIYFSLRLSGLFVGRQEYDSVINNLEALSLRIKELANDGKELSVQTMPFSIPDNYILIGFSYDDKGDIRTECTHEAITKSKSKICQSKACMCVYQNSGGVTDLYGKDFDSKENVNPLKCKPFDGNIIFLAPPESPNFMGSKSKWQPTHYRDSSYNNLVIYGICGGPWKTSWGVKRIYIEKYKENGNTFIFIGDMSKEDIIKRSDYIKNTIHNHLIT